MARRRTWERRNRGMTDLSAKPLALIKGAGDLATGVALRLHHVGFRLVMTEIEEPTVVRRTVALAEAVYEGESVVEGMKAPSCPPRRSHLHKLPQRGRLCVALPWVPQSPSSPGETPRDEGGGPHQ